MMKWIILCSIAVGALGAPSEQELQCEVCHTLVYELRDLVKEGLTQHQIINYIQEICQKLPSYEKDVCHFFLQDHSKELFDRPAADLTPHEVCQKLPNNICQSPVIQPVEEPVQEPVVELNPEPAIEAVQEPVKEPLEENVNTLECTLCKFVVDTVEKYAKTNKSIAFINSTLEKLCQDLPEQLSAICQQFEPKVIQFIEKGVPPEDACRDIKLCSDENVPVPCDICYTVTEAIGIKDTEAICSKLESCQAEVDATEQEQSAPETEEDPKEGILCFLCKFVIQAVDKFIDNNKTEAAINSTLEKLCQSLPQALSAPCLQYEPYVVKAIEEGLPADVACKLAKACTDESAPVPCDVCYTTAEAIGIKDTEAICSKYESCQAEVDAFEQEQSAPETEEDPQDDTECILCKFVVQVVEKLVESNKSIAAINSTLEKLCHSLPDKLSKLCVQYEPYLIQLIEQEQPPDVACELVKMCKDAEAYPYVDGAYIPCDVCQATLEAVAGEKGVGVCFDIPGVCLMPGQLLEQEPEPPRQPIPVCEVCQFMVKSVKDQLHSFGEENIVETFERVCNQMPDQEQQFCSKYGSTVIELLMSGVNDPRQSCVQMTVCEPFEEQEPVQQEPFVVAMEQEANVKYLQDDPKCEVCTLLVSILREILKDNKTQAIVNATLYKFCDFLPTTFELRALCRTLVPQVIAMAKQGVDPTKACDDVGLCTNGSSASLTEICDNCMGILEKTMPSEFNEEAADAVCTRVCHGRHKRSVPQIQFGIGEIKKAVTEMKGDVKEDKKVAGVVECTACKILVQAVDDFVHENKTERTINNTVYQICQNLTGQQLVQKCLQAAPKLVQAIMKGLDPDKTCQAAKMCPEDNSSIKTLVKRSSEEKETRSNKLNDAKCDICKFLINLFDERIATNASKEEINKTIYGLCEDLVDPLKSFCLQYAPDIVTIFEKGIDPTAACTKIGLCSQGTDSIRELKTLKTVKETVDRKAKANSLECDLCKLVINYLDKRLETNASKEEINKTIYEFCEKLPDPLKSFCLQSAPTILSIFEKGIDPTAACTKIGLCSQGTGSSRKPTALKMAMKEVLRKEKRVNDAKCTLCKTIVGIIDSEVTKNSSAAKINETVYKFCDDLSGAVKLLCLEIAPTIVKDIEKGFNSTVTCQKLGLCSEQRDMSKGGKLSEVLNLKQIQRVEEEKENTLECELCKAALQILDKYIAENSSEKVINDTVYRVCGGFPGALKEMCYKFAPRVVEVLVGGVDPDLVCEKIGICQSGEEKSVVIKEKQEPTDQACDVCTALVEFFAEFIPANESDKDANKTLHQICDDFIPDFLHDDCIALIPRLVHVVHDRNNPKKACEDINICNNTVAAKLVPYLTQLRHQKLIRKGKEQKSLKCDVCMNVMQAIYDDLSENYPKIRRAIVSNVCNKLPEVYKVACTKMSSTHLSGYWKIFLGNYTPSLMCEMAGCTEKTFVDDYPRDNNRSNRR